jgi:hypothetical protein
LINQFYFSPGRERVARELQVSAQADNRPPLVWAAPARRNQRLAVVARRHGNPSNYAWLTLAPGGICPKDERSDL